MRAGLRTAATVLIALAMTLSAPDRVAAGGGDDARGPGTAVKGSGLPVPRFVSLKSDRVNVRKGPSTDHGVAWIFKRAGLPVEITAEFEHWRKVRDSEGAEGWVFRGLLSARRTAVVTPWSKSDEAAPLHRSRGGRGGVVAQLQPGVLANVSACDGEWCLVALDRVEGWLSQDLLWGVYRGETIE
jgi:SH3-like domain-containing protein